MLLVACYVRLRAASGNELLFQESLTKQAVGQPAQRLEASRAEQIIQYVTGESTTANKAGWVGGESS